jgi:hypothetical protein
MEWQIHAGCIKKGNKPKIPQNLWQLYLNMVCLGFSAVSSIKLFWRVNFWVQQGVFQNHWRWLVHKNVVRCIMNYQKCVKCYYFKRPRSRIEFNVNQVFYIISSFIVHKTPTKFAPNESKLRFKSTNFVRI